MIQYSRLYINHCGGSGFEPDVSDVLFPICRPSSQQKTGIHIKTAATQQLRKKTENCKPETENCKPETENCKTETVYTVLSIAILRQILHESTSTESWEGTVAADVIIIFNPSSSQYYPLSSTSFIL
jgi:hypothetical protein